MIGLNAPMNAIINILRENEDMLLEGSIKMLFSNSLGLRKSILRFIKSQSGWYMYTQLIYQDKKIGYMTHACEIEKDKFDKIINVIKSCVTLYEDLSGSFNITMAYKKKSIVITVSTNDDCKTYRIRLKD